MFGGVGAVAVTGAAACPGGSAGDTLRGSGFTAAHKTLPFGTRVRVIDLKTGRSVIVTITDRGPFNHGRVLDLCTRAARALGMIDRGVIRVRAEILPREDVVAGP